MQVKFIPVRYQVKFFTFSVFIYVVIFLDYLIDADKIERQTNTDKLTELSSLFNNLNHINHINHTKYHDTDNHINQN